MRCKTLETLIQTIYMPLCANEHPDPVYLCIYFLLLADYLQTLHVLWLTISVVLCALIDCDCDMDHESAA